MNEDIPLTGAKPAAQSHALSLRRAVLVTLLSWLAMLGVDFLVHAGILARLYLQPSPFLLPLSEAFARIPLGYASLLVFTVLQVWLMVRLETRGWRAGLSFGLTLGVLVSGSEAIGLFSISTADALLLLGWFLGQTVEFGIAGAVAGRGLEGERIPRLLVWVIVFVLAMFVVTVALQSVSMAPALRFDRS